MTLCGLDADDPGDKLTWAPPRCPGEEDEFDDLPRVDCMLMTLVTNLTWRLPGAQVNYGLDADDLPCMDWMPMTLVTNLTGRTTGDQVKYGLDAYDLACLDWMSMTLVTNLTRCLPVAQVKKINLMTFPVWIFG